MTNNTPWYECSNVAEVDSPALLVFADRAEENVRRMIALAGGPERLCPHVKTHKLAELVRLQMTLGITKFKCATIAEAEMTAGCGAPEVLLAVQPVGPKVSRLIQLIQKTCTESPPTLKYLQLLRMMTKSVELRSELKEEFLAHLNRTIG